MNKGSNELNFKSNTINSSRVLYGIDLIKYTVLTEKTYLSLYNKRQYTFDVDKSMTKKQIKELVSKIFNVDIISINTHVPPRRKIRVGLTQGYRASCKRAIVTLKKGQTIQFN